MSAQGTKKRKRPSRGPRDPNKRRHTMAEIKTQIIKGQVPIDPLLDDVLNSGAGEFYRNALNRNIASVNPTNAFKDDDDIIMGSRDDDKEKTDEELASIALGEGGLGFHNLGNDPVIAQTGRGRRRKRKSRRKKKTRRKRGRKRRKRKTRGRRRR